MTPKSLTTLAVTFLGGSIVTFVGGLVLLGAGFAAGHGGGGSIGFLSSGSSPASAEWQHGTPTGLFLMTRYWIGTGSLEKAAYYFSDDGHVYVNPDDGFTNDKLGAHAQQQGTVTTDGDNMTITWSDGKPESSKIERDKTGFAWDMGLFAPVKAFSSPNDLVGKWEGGSSVTVNGGYAASAQTLDLHEDGSFGGESAGTVVAADNESRASGGSSSKSSGHWKLDGYVLTLEYDDGHELHGIAFPFDDRFYFKSVLYKKM